ncbi:Hypothetical protein A7982_04225 [Minicystis rosea]|nr:Hypothetical protein A7982_04225 [Minicystis rosea]
MTALARRTRRWDDEIARLDPDESHREIVQLLSDHVFPLEMLVALELAQLRTFTIPSISRVLHGTRQYEDEGERRLDDTRAILNEIHQNGLDTPEGRQTVEHLNRIHSLYKIAADDFLYVLSTFIFDPVLFVEKHGHRPFTMHEKRALFASAKCLGEAMKIPGIPQSYAEFFAWRRAYERAHQRYAPENEAVARGFLRAVGTLAPPWVAPSLEGIAVVLFDDPTACSALGLRAPVAPLRIGVRALARLWCRTSRHVNPFEHASASEMPWLNTYPTYPNGYDRTRLGPKKIIKLFDQQDRERSA